MLDDRSSILLATVWCERLVLSTINFLSGHATDANLSKQSFTNPPSDNFFPLLAMTSVIRKLILVAFSELF